MRSRAGAAAFSQRFSRGYQNWISAQMGATRPVGFCIGAVSAIAVAGSSSDTLFVMHGGIPSNAVC